MSLTKQVELIVNPVSGGGRTLKSLSSVESALRDLGLEVKTESTRDISHARELARAAAERAATVVAFGGDGLVGAVAGELVGSDTTLAVLPGGRGNDFARVLGIPSDPVEAAALIGSGRVRRLDIGSIDGAHFVGIASTGFDAVANRLANEARLISGNLVYAYAGLRALIGWKPVEFELELDGQTVRRTGYTVAAANSQAYGGGMYVAPDAELDDGLLDVVVIGDLSKWTFATQLPKVFKGQHTEHPKVEVFRAREVRISCERQFDVYADGDRIGELPATITVEPKALRVIVPGVA